MPGAIIFSGPRPASSNQETKANESKNSDTHEGTANSFGAVYVNSLGRDAINADPPIQFPSGSIIVRERLAEAGDTQPQHLTVMIKRTSGFNPAANDWEFLAIDGAMTTIQTREKKGSCLDCHATQRARDFVYPERTP